MIIDEIENRIRQHAKKCLFNGVIIPLFLDEYMYDFLEEYSWRSGFGFKKPLMWMGIKCYKKQTISLRNTKE